MVKPAEIRPLPGQNFCAYIPDHIGSLISGLLSADHCHWSLTHVGLSLFPSSLLDLTQFPILDLDPWTGSLTLWLHIHPLCHVFWEITVTYCHFCSANCPSTNNCLKNCSQQDFWDFVLVTKAANMFPPGLLLQYKPIEYCRSGCLS